MNTERSFAAPRTFSDEHIEHWASVYLDPYNNRQLRALHVKFERFLLAPEVFLAALGRPRVIVTSCGLLPAQRDVQRRLDLMDKFVRAFRGEWLCADGRWVEKLKHHAYPRHRDRRTLKE